MRKKLTNTTVESFAGGGKYERGKKAGQLKEHDVLWDTEIKGLGVRYAMKSGTRTYIFQFRVKDLRNSEQTITLGRHNDPLRIDHARAKALELKSKMIGGVNPVAEARRKQEESERQAALDKALSTTLRRVIEDYLENKRTKHGPLRPRSKRDIRDLEKNLTIWLDEPVADITRDMCLAKFTAMSERTPTQANKMARNLRALLNHAREMHATDDGDFPILAVNPVSRMFKLRKPNPENPSATRIPLNKVGACWNWLRARAVEARKEDDRTAADWVSFIMLTGMRRFESGSLKWSDVDLVARTITLREDVVKNHTQLVLPMSAVMHELLTARKNPPALPHKILLRRRAERSAEYVFATNGKKCPHIENAQTVVKKLSEIAGAHVHLHSLRRTFDDIATEVRVDADQRRLLINHKSGDVHSRHYANNTRALTTAVESIAQWIINAAVVAEQVASGANVIAFPGRQA